MVYIDDHIDDFDLQAALAELSEQRRQQALRFRFERGQRTCALAYLLLKRALHEEFDIDAMARHLREVKYIANIAEEYGRKDLAFGIEKKLLAYEEKVLATANQSKLTEIEAKMGNDVLSAKVNEEARRAEAAFRLAAILLVVILAVVIIFLVIYTRSLKRTNERVRLADAAKTRFVQNMSHEVRTPP